MRPEEARSERVRRRELEGGLVGEFETGAAMLEAIRKLRRQGYERLEAYSPYPVHGVEEALEIPRSRVPLVVFAAGITGAGLAYFVQWYCNAHDYPLNVGARPLNSVPAWIIIIFEMGILFAAVAALAGFCALTRLPRLHDPVFEVEGFERASVDRFFVAIGLGDPRFDIERSASDLRAAGAVRVTPVPGDEGRLARPEPATAAAGREGGS
jgi:hypothetical protein